MNFFSSPQYLSALAEAYFPKKQWQIRCARVGSEVYQLLRVGREWVRWVPFMDFLEPVDAPPAARLSHLPAVMHDRVDVVTHQARTLAPGQQVSPCVDWTQFASWDAFVTYARRLAGFKSVTRRMANRLGDRLVFTWSDAHGMDDIIAWKSAQYRAAGYADAFRSPKLRRHFQVLRERGLLTISTLRVDGTLVAGHVGIADNGRFYYWLPAYDKAWAQFSVGSILLDRILEASFHAGHRELDFLLGNERYKWSYATHVRTVGPAGQAPLVERLWLPARQRALALVKNSPTLYQRLQAIKRRALEWKLTLGTT